MCFFYHRALSYVPYSGKDVVVIWKKKIFVYNIIRQCYCIYKIQVKKNVLENTVVFSHVGEGA
jgi:hypothetical protein